MIRLTLTTAALILTSLTLLFGQDNNATTIRNQSIENRAKEITPFLPQQPFGIGRYISDRNAWDSVPKAKIIKLAENLISKPIPELPESLYKEYHHNGNRTNYQNALHKKYQRLHIFALAECIENNGRFIPPLEEIIKSICADKSWVYPAHDTNAEIYDGKSIHIDLFSSHVSCELGLVISWLGNKLSAETKKLIRNNVEHRTFKVYENAVKSGKKGRNWWITGNNNWNAVCHCNVVCAALTLIEDATVRAWYIAAAEKFITQFLNGFTADGYCSEGIGYWNYGFGHFLQLAEVIYQNTDGKVDFFTMPRVRNCAMFAFKMEVESGLYAAFADCSIGTKPNATFTKYISQRLQLGYTNYEKYQNQPDNLKMTGVFCFPNSTSKIQKISPQNTPLEELRTEFPDGGVMIFRPQYGYKNQLSVVLKAGHNAEHHNHNDVGSYAVMLDGTTPILDPGGEVYTKRTFSNKRYDSNLLNSFGHPVPIINGQLQKNGYNASGKFIAKKFSDNFDTCTINLAPAYKLKEIKKLERTFEFTRKNSNLPNSLTVIDEIELESDGTFETALITYDKYTKISNKFEITNNKNQTDKNPVDKNKIELTIGELDGKIVSVEVSAFEDKKHLPLIFETTEIKEDALAKKNPTRLDFKINQKIKKAKIITTIKKATP
jgi:hypothetical protein